MDIQFLVSLYSINFGKNFNTKNVKNMSHIFYDCISMTLLDLSYFITSKVNCFFVMNSLYYAKIVCARFRLVSLTGKI